MAHRGKLTRIEPTFDGAGARAGAVAAFRSARRIASCRPTVSQPAARRSPSRGRAREIAATLGPRTVRRGAPAGSTGASCSPSGAASPPPASSSITARGCRASPTGPIPDRPPNVKIVSVDGKLIANRGMTGGEAVGLHEMSPYIPHGRHRHRGPPLLFAFRRRSDRPGARHGQQSDAWPLLAGRLDADPAAGQEPVPEAGAHAGAQGAGGAAGAVAGAASTARTRSSKCI